MFFIGDFHIHSKYSRATSRLMDLLNLDRWAQIKGITVLGTGDFTHPDWIRELKSQLSPAEQGLFRLKKHDSPTRFMLTSEISCIYSKKGKVRKNHLIIFSPSFESVEKINNKLDKIGNIESDGRPILGLDSKELIKIILEINENCFIVPAHAWTPWFSVFGSKSGFDSLEECFEDLTKYIYAIETGLSSNPAMNWRLSQLDNITLISNSDAHSLQKLGREANVFDTELSYQSIFEAIKTKDKNKFLYTIEFFPEEGKYHYDGHRVCKINLSPVESKKYNNICPVCGKTLIIGVLNRVEELADRPEGFIPENAIPFKSIVPLNEIIAKSIGMSITSKEVDKYYNNLIKNLGNEFHILLKTEQSEIEKESNSKIAEAVIRVREGKIDIEPGYDGVYGNIKIFKEEEKNLNGKFQKNLF